LAEPVDRLPELVIFGGRDMKRIMLFAIPALAILAIATSTAHAYPPRIVVGIGVGPGYYPGYYPYYPYRPYGVYVAPPPVVVVAPPPPPVVVAPGTVVAPPPPPGSYNPQVIIPGSTPAAQPSAAPSQIPPLAPPLPVPGNTVPSPRP
jgi:hypothetical protein